MDPEREHILVTETALSPEVPAGYQAECLEIRGLPEDGDLIVYVPSGKPALFRRFRKEPGGQVLLEALNGTSYRCSQDAFLNNGRVLVILEAHKVFPAGKRLRQVPDARSVPADSDFLTLPEAMKLMKVGKSRMYSLLQTGTLPAVKLGRLWRIDRRAVYRLLASGVPRKS